MLKMKSMLSQLSTKLELKLKLKLSLAIDRKSHQVSKTSNHRFSRDRRLKICWVKCATMLKIVLLDVHKRFQKYSN